MKSMTGFAQGRYSGDGYTLFVSFKSVNNRYLELSLRGSGATPEIEKLVREVLEGRLLRGRVEVVVELAWESREAWDVQLNEPLLGEIVDRLDAFREKSGENLPFTLDPLLRLPMVLRVENRMSLENEALRLHMRQCLEEVFGRFLESRVGEAQRLRPGLLKSLEIISGVAAALESRAPGMEKELFLRQRERLAQLVADMQMDESRLTQEAALLAEKHAIHEETSRLRAHAQRLHALLSAASAHGHGREADFLCQEMLRETHTIAAKAADLDIHNDVLALRREIEKIRQQVQNIE
jgi:uncharacterized protein (TIGR00255 family)